MWRSAGVLRFGSSHSATSPRARTNRTAPSRGPASRVSLGARFRGHDGQGRSAPPLTCTASAKPKVAPLPLKAHSCATSIFEGADMKRAVPVLLLVLAACATPATQRPAVSSQATDEEARTQLAMAFNRRMDMADQLWRVNYRLGAAASDLCGDHVDRVTGMLVQTIAGYSEQYRPAALARYPALGTVPSVTYVAPGSAADAA